MTLTNTTDLPKGGKAFPETMSMPCWRQTHKKNTMWRQRQIGDCKLCRCKPRNTKNQWSPPEARKMQGRIPPRVSEGAWPWWHLDLDFQLPGLLFWATPFVALWYAVLETHCFHKAKFKRMMFLPSKRLHYETNGYSQQRYTSRCLCWLFSIYTQPLPFSTLLWAWRADS